MAIALKAMSRPAEKRMAFANRYFQPVVGEQGSAAEATNAAADDYNVCF